MFHKIKLHWFCMIMLICLLFPLSVSAAGLSISKESATIESGASLQLTAKQNGSKVSGTWKSSNAKVAAVSKKGKVTGKAAGSARITVSYKGEKAECLVSVLKKSSGNTARYTVLIMDTSSSMKGAPFAQEKTAAKRFCNKILKTSGANYIAILALSGSGIKEVSGFTSSYNTLSSAIDAQKANSYTNLNAALLKAQSLLDNVTSKKKTVLKNVVLCSDGLPNRGSTSLSGRYASNEDETHYKYANADYKTDVKIKKKGYFVYALGFYGNSKDKFLSFGKKHMKDLASVDKYYEIASTNDITKAFDTIATTITSLTISDSSVTLDVGSTKQLSVYANGKAATASWSSSNQKIVTVSSKGKLTGIAAGTATITAKVSGKKVTCKVTVKDKYPSGTTVSNNHHYKLFNTSMTWDKAKAYCEQLGGHLVTITSAAEQAFVEKYVVKGTKNYYWIGAQRDSNNRFSKWVTGEPISYTHYDTQNGEPNNYRGLENVLVFFRIPNPNGGRDSGLKWNDLRSDGYCYGESFFGVENSGFICEWDS